MKQLLLVVLVLIFTACEQEKSTELDVNNLESLQPEVTDKELQPPKPIILE